MNTKQLTTLLATGLLVAGSLSASGDDDDDVTPDTGINTTTVISDTSVPSTSG